MTKLQLLQGLFNENRNRKNENSFAALFN